MAEMPINKGFLYLELTSGLEPPNLLLTKQVLYLLSYVSIICCSINFDDIKL